MYQHVHLPVIIASMYYLHVGLVGLVTKRSVALCIYIYRQVYVQHNTLEILSRKWQ